MSAARGCSPTERMRRPERRPEQERGTRATTSASASQIIRFSCPNAPLEEVARSAGCGRGSCRWMSGIAGMSEGVPVRAVDVDEQVAGDPEARKLIAVPPTIWSARRLDREERVEERQQRRRPASRSRARPPSSRSCPRPRSPKKAAGQHHPLEADVHDAAALGEHAADRGEDAAASRSASVAASQRRPREHVSRLPRPENVAMRARRDRRGTRRRDRAPAEALLAARERPDAAAAAARKPIDDRQRRSCAPSIGGSATSSAKRPSTIPTIPTCAAADHAEVDAPDRHAGDGHARASGRARGAAAPRLAAASAARSRCRARARRRRRRARRGPG